MNLLCIAVLAVAFLVAAPGCAAAPSGRDVLFAQADDFISERRENAMPACVEGPSPEEALRSLTAGHPRLLATDRDFERVKRLIASDAFCRQLYDAIAKRAEKTLTEPASTYVLPDGVRMLHVSRRVLERVTTLAMVVRVTGDRRCLDRLWTEIEAAGNFADWRPAHFLDTAEMTLAFALAYDWLYDAWTPEQRRFMERAIIDKGLDAALSVGYGNDHAWFARRTNNWNQVCNGGLLAGALAVAEAAPDRAAAVVAQSVASLPTSMTLYAPDGAWEEGPVYWSYGTSFNVVALEALRTALGRDYGLARIPGFEKAAMFPVYMTGPIERTFNFSDCSDRSVRSSMLLWFAREFDQPVAQDYFRRMMTDDDGRLDSWFGRLGPLGLLWYDARLNDASVKQYATAMRFKGVECGSFYERHGDRDAMFLAFKGGMPSVGHGNIDSGTFVFDADGVRWALDLGAENYNIPGYWGRHPGGQRWSYYRMRAEGHNTLAINSGSGEDQDVEAVSPLVAFENTDARAVAAVDLTPAYRGFGVNKAMRRFEMSRGGGADRYVAVTDTIVPAGAAEIWWFLHTEAQAKLSADGRSVVLSRDGRRLRVTLEAPAGARLEVMDARPLPTSPQPTEANANDGVRKLAVHLAGVAQPVEIRVKLIPVSD